MHAVGDTLHIRMGNVLHMYVYTYPDDLPFAGEPRVAVGPLRGIGGGVGPRELGQGDVACGGRCVSTAPVLRARAAVRRRWWVLRLHFW